MRYLKIAIILMIALLPVTAFCQTEDSFEFKPVSDDNLFWPIDKNKGSEITIKKDNLILVNKLQDHYLCALTKVRLDFRGNVVVGGIVIPKKVDDKHRFGFIFNAKNDENFHAIVLIKNMLTILLSSADA